MITHYAIYDLRQKKVSWTGIALWKCAEKLVAGTVFGKGETEAEAVEDAIEVVLAIDRAREKR